MHKEVTIIENKYTRDDLKTMQAWDLERKIQVSQTRILEWQQYWSNKTSVSFSGGKDSAVLLDLVARVNAAHNLGDVNAVFADTGLEYPEIKVFVRDFVGHIESKHSIKVNLEVVKPAMSFREVIEKHGYPVVSKEVSARLYYARGGSEWAIKNMDGLDRHGRESKLYKSMYGKWNFLMSAPFKISHKCCDELKLKPLKKYHRRTKLVPILGTMASDSFRRLQGYLSTGCAIYADKSPRLVPMGFWHTEDVLQYVRDTGLPICSVYGAIEKTKEKLATTGVNRTGCVFCMFGVHLEKGENSFQKLSKSHPKLHDYCINSLGCGKVLDYLGVEY